MFVHYILLIIINEILSNITLPFTLSQKSLKGMNHSSIMNTLINNNLIVNITVGSPQQKISLSLNHNIFQVTVASSKLETKEEINKFDANSSSTYNKIFRRLNPMSEISECYESTDLFNFNVINFTKLENFKFLLVLQQPEKYKVSGNLGLRNAATGNFLPEYNFILQLKKQNLISSYNYYIQYFNNLEGEIVFGTLPHENINFNYEVNDYITIKGIHHNINGYKFEYDNLFYGNNIININIKIPVEIKIENGLIKANDQYKNMILEKFFNKLFESKKCFIEKFYDYNQYYFYYCDKSIDITKFEPLIFELKEINFNFTLDYNDLFFKYEDYYYFLVYFKEKFNSGIELGAPFFKKYIITFNQDSKLIGFYREVKLKKYHFNINWALVFCLFIIIVMLIYIIFSRPIFKKKKKRANELEDEFEYLPKNYAKIETINKLGI